MSILTFWGSPVRSSSQRSAPSAPCNLPSETFFINIQHLWNFDSTYNTQHLKCQFIVHLHLWVWRSVIRSVSWLTLHHVSLLVLWSEIKSGINQKKHWKYDIISGDCQLKLLIKGSHTCKIIFSLLTYQ